MSLLLKTLGAAGRLVEIGGRGTKTPSRHPWYLHGIYESSNPLSDPFPLWDVFLNLSEPCTVNNCCFCWRLSPFVHLWDSLCEPAVLLSITSHRPFMAIPVKHTSPSPWKGHWSPPGGIISSLVKSQVTVHFFHYQLPISFLLPSALELNDCLWAAMLSTRHLH